MAVRCASGTGKEFDDCIRLRRGPAATASDLSADEMPIEITETAEEPVVSKQPKVVEEVVLQKAAAERAETVKAVRRKDVNVKKAA